MERNFENNVYFFNAFKKLEQSYTKHLLKALGRFTLSPNEIEVLCCLIHTNSAREIVAMTDVSKGLVSRSVKSLKEKGYITAEVSNTDKREQTLVLTAKGEEIRLAIEETRAQFFEKAFTHFETTERQVFEALLKLMTNNIGA